MRSSDLPEPREPGVGGLPALSPQRQCAYCGAKLDPTFYFCRRCATPYVDESAVLPALRPQRLFPGRLIREHAPHAMGIFWTYLGVLLGGGILCYATLGEANTPAFFVVMEGLLLLVTVVFAVLYGRALASQLVRPGFGRWEAWAGLASLAPLLLLNWAWHTFLMRMSGLEHESLTRPLLESGFGQAGVVFVLCVFPAVTEELAFRGLVQHWLHVAVQPRQAIVYAAALFTALHGSILSAPYLFLVGCLFGWLRWRTGSLYPSMLAHFLHNLGVVAFLDR